MVIREHSSLPDSLGPSLEPHCSCVVHKKPKASADHQPVLGEIGARDSHILAVASASSVPGITSLRSMISTSRPVMS